MTMIPRGSLKPAPGSRSRAPSTATTEATVTASSERQMSRIET